MNYSKNTSKIQSCNSKSVLRCEDEELFAPQDEARKVALRRSFTSSLSILEIAQIVGHTTTQMIVQNYGKYIKGEHLRIDRNLKLFTDKSTDRLA